MRFNILDFPRLLCLLFNHNAATAMSSLTEFMGLARSVACAKGQTPKRMPIPSPFGWPFD